MSEQETTREELLRRVREAAQREPRQVVYQDKSRVVPVDHAANLKEHLGTAFGFPPHLNDALRSWVDSVEQRWNRSAAPQSGEPGTRVDTLHLDFDSTELKDVLDELRGVVGRVAAVETAVADLKAALSDKPAPAGVQKAVADVEVPQPNPPEEDTPVEEAPAPIRRGRETC